MTKMWVELEEDVCNYFPWFEKSKFAGESAAFGVAESGEGEIEVRVLAVCNYDKKEQYYLFACDEHFHVLGDTVHQTVEEAMKFAEEYYEQDMIEWFE